MQFCGFTWRAQAQPALEVHDLPDFEPRVGVEIGHLETSKLDALLTDAGYGSIQGNLRLLDAMTFGIEFRPIRSLALSASLDYAVLQTINADGEKLTYLNSHNLGFALGYRVFGTPSLRLGVFGGIVVGMTSIRLERQDDIYAQNFSQLLLDSSSASKDLRFEDLRGTVGFGARYGLVTGEAEGWNRYFSLGIRVGTDIPFVTSAWFSNGASSNTGPDAPRRDLYVDICVTTFELESGSP